jgi:hypothetical protein
VVTVGGDAASVERRLAAGVLRCPCGGVLAPWGHAVWRRVSTVEGCWELRPRRSRCGGCEVTHVLLPTRLFSRRQYEGAIIWACVLARLRGASLASIARRAGCAISTLTGWLARLGGERVERFRRALTGALDRLDARVRPVAPGGGVAGAGPLGEALAVAEAVAVAVRRRGLEMGVDLDMVTGQQLASHLSRGRLLAPTVDLDPINTSAFGLPA